MQDLYSVTDDEIQGRITALEHVIALLTEEIRNQSGAGVVSNIIDKMVLYAARSQDLNATRFSTGYRAQLATMEILMCEISDERSPQIDQ